MNPLFQAHCPQHGYLTKLCDHSYCSILSVAEYVPGLHRCKWI